MSVDGTEATVAAEVPIGAAEAQALDDAVATAGDAPSILNTQPWRWRQHGHVLELALDPARTLAVADPDRRLATVSCGAALHHALVSLAAAGWHTTVTRAPGTGSSGHLATVRVGGRIPIEPESIARLRAIGLRYTDRRPVAGVHLDADKLRPIVAAAASQGSSLLLLRPRQAFELARAADDAHRTETDGPAWQAELQRWAGGVRPGDTGLPGAVLPSAAAPATVVRRDFGHRGDMLVGEANDRSAAYGILYGDEDQPLDWIRAGEALSAAWLTATELEVAVLPLSATIEVPANREAVRELLDGAGHPFLVLRFTALDPTAADGPHTPRLSTGQTVERAATDAPTPPSDLPEEDLVNENLDCGDLPERHIPSINEELVHQGECGRVHLPTGDTCTLHRHHDGSCQFVMLGGGQPGR
ncbi:Acg family FMN-binding oxidoreductase [Actinoplanes awajinensis]|uniref:Acg family FMN-binding oxidoreductase n=1 Tax=Actinoplanes awajinensis TaxID=135946 RepID=UPI0018DE9212|nr:nitroreductase [Actinoplanes awajinensis]